RNFHRVFRGPDFGVRRIEVTQHRMQRGRLTRTGRAADEEQAVGLADHILQDRQVVLAETELVDRNRFARRQNPHDDILYTALHGNRRDAKFDIKRPELLELDLAVLRLTALGNVQIAHDLDARNQGAAVGGGNFDVRHEAAVLAKTNLRLRLAWIGFDMDVRRTLVIGVDNDLVDELDQLVVGSGGQILSGAVLFNFVLIQPFEQVADVADIRFQAIKLVQRVTELLACREDVADLVARKDVVDDA